VLVADDSVSTRRFLKMMLERQGGYVVEVAEDGRQALELMKLKTFDMVLLDLDMPVMNGFSCASAFREWEKGSPSRRHARQSICVLSAHSDVRELQMAASVEVDFYETKPAKIPTLLRITEQCVAEVWKARAAADLRARQASLVPRTNAGSQPGSPQGMASGKSESAVGRRLSTFMGWGGGTAADDSEHTTSSGDLDFEEAAMHVAFRLLNSDGQGITKSARFQ